MRTDLEWPRVPVRYNNEVGLLRPKNGYSAHICSFQNLASCYYHQIITIRDLRADYFIFSGQVFSVPSKAPADSNRLERGTAMALRSLLVLLLVYIVFHKIFPFALFRTRLADMTGGDFVMMVCRSLIATAGAAYIAVKGFAQPALHERDRIWCERWAGLAFGVLAIIVGAVLVTTLQGEGFVFALAYWVASGVLWLLF
jgi:hypothetical protein